MSGIQPRRVAHRGKVEAAGFAFDVGLLGEAEARRRVLGAWAPGATVWRVDDLLVLRLGRAVRVDARTAPGAPLVHLEGASSALSAAPLDAAELRRLAPGRGDAVVVRGGEAVAVPLGDDARVRPESWLDLSGFHAVEAVSLGAAPAAPRVVAAPEPFEARARLGAVGAPPEELARVVAALEAKPAPAAANGKGSGGSGAPTPAGRRAGPRGWLGGWIEDIATALMRTTAGIAEAEERLAKASGRAYAPPRGPSLFDRLAARLDRLSAWLLRTTRLDELVGRRQADYIRRMMEMLDGGDVMDGLRHAIPLGALAAAERSRPALGVPRARADLRIVPARGRAGASIGMGESLMEEIRRLYRATFERLEAQGRVEEAAFVLAELLRADAEAIAFLERHGRERLAAEMAEARELPPGLVVRQWFVAGDRARAVTFARRTGSFADAVLRLERTDRKQADVLRLLWAAALADAGDYAKAVEVAWPVEAARRLTLELLDRAVALGGAEGARMLARRLVAAPTDEARARALALLEDESPEGARARAELATAIASGERSPTASAVARAAARALLRDSGYATAALRPTVLSALVDASGDVALRSDIAALPTSAVGALRNRTSPVEHAVAASDAGALAATDAVLLPDGRTVVALGELGARILSRGGRTLAMLDEPAHRLVVSDNGDRAIALAPRGDVWRLARLDFAARTAEPWCEARIEAWADTYDGSLWLLGADGDFYAIDASARRFDALWRAPDVGGCTLAVARSGVSAAFLTSGRRAERWQYELPLLRLRSREDVLLPEFSARHERWTPTISADGSVFDAAATVLADEPPGRASLRLNWTWTTPHSVWLGVDGDEPLRPSIAAGLVAAPVVRSDGARVVVAETSTGRTLIDVELAGAGFASARVREDAVTIADDRGRVLVFDLASGALVRDFRL